MRRTYLECGDNQQAHTYALKSLLVAEGGLPFAMASGWGPYMVMHKQIYQSMVSGFAELPVMQLCVMHYHPCMDGFNDS
jgi:hypothetical protein